MRDEAFLRLSAEALFWERGARGESDNAEIRRRNLGI